MSRPHQSDEMGGRSVPSSDTWWWEDEEEKEDLAEVKGNWPKNGAKPLDFEYLHQSSDHRKPPPSTSSPPRRTTTHPEMKTNLLALNFSEFALQFVSIAHRRQRDCRNIADLLLFHISVCVRGFQGNKQIRFFFLGRPRISGGARVELRRTIGT